MQLELVLSLYHVGFRMIELMSSGLATSAFSHQLMALENHLYFTYHLYVSSISIIAILYDFFVDCLGSLPKKYNLGGRKCCPKRLILNINVP